MSEKDLLITAIASLVAVVGILWKILQNAWTREREVYESRILIYRELVAEKDLQMQQMQKRIEGLYDTFLEKKSEASAKRKV